MWHRLKNIFIFILLLLVAAGGTATLVLLNENSQANTRQQQLTTQLQSCLAGEDVPADSPTCRYSTSQSCYHQSANGWLVLNLPCENQVATANMQVKGVAFGAFENNLNYEIVNSTGVVVDDGFITVEAPDLGVPGIFDTSITIDETSLTQNTGEGKLRIFMESAEDGSELNVVEIQIQL